MPTYADFLGLPSERPATFWRGYDVYALDRLGYVSSGPVDPMIRFFDEHVPDGEPPPRLRPSPSDPRSMGR